MSETIVCRLCLATDVHLSIIANTYLQDMYEKLTNIALNSMEKPTAACYLCAYQLRKCQDFTERVIRADKLLTQMLQAGNKITSKSIAMVDREANKLCTNLVMTPVQRDGLDFYQPVLEIKQEIPCEMEEMSCDLADMQSEQGTLPDRKIKMNDIENKNILLQEHSTPGEVSDHNAEIPEESSLLEKLLNQNNEKSKIYMGTLPDKKIQINNIENGNSHLLEHSMPAEFSELNAEKPKENNEKIANENIKGTPKMSLNICLICDDCGKKFKNKSMFLDYVERRKVKKEVHFNCGSCRYGGGNSEKNVINRTSNQMQEGSSESGTSDKTFRRKKRLKSPTTPDKPHQCPVCDYSCKKKWNLYTHIRTHTGETRYKCMVCEYRCYEKRDLRRHIRRHTGEKPYACTVCEYRCTIKNSLTKHLKTHCEEKNFECRECELKFDTKLRLNQHLKTHFGVKIYVCQLCELKCVSLTRLKAHIRTHTGEKPYECSECGFRCNQRSDLKRHLRTHTGDKPYECDVCENKYSRKIYLIKHLQTHFGEKAKSNELTLLDEASSVH